MAGRVATISKEQVFAVAESMKAAGRTPTIASIRETLGSGSSGTIHRWLSEWKTGQSAGTAPEISVPESVIRAITDFAVSVCSASKSAFEGDLATQSASLEEVSRENEAFAKMIDEMEEEIKNLRSAKSELSGQITWMKEEAAKLDTDLERARLELENVRMELAKSLLRMESIPRMEFEVEKLREDLRLAEKARVDAEREAAVAAARSESLGGQVKEFQDRIGNLEKEAKAGAAAERQVAVLAAQAEAMALKIEELQKREIRIYSDIESERTAHREILKDRENMIGNLLKERIREEKEPPEKAG